MRIAITMIGLALLGITTSCQSTTSLFNGKNLDGWQVYGTEKWYVNDQGLLVSESGPDKQYGYLATDKTYKDFEITAEFKQEDNGNSGIFFRSNIEGTKNFGLQAEVAQPDYYTGWIYESYGRRWLINPAKEKYQYLKFGECNTMNVRVV